MKIGFICICTGKYIMYLNQLLSSFIEYFIPNAEKVFFVFTDNEIPEYIDKYTSDTTKIVYIKQNQIGWPYDTLYRFKIVNQNKNIIDQYNLDYMFFCNINLCCRSLIESDEIIPIELDDVEENEKKEGIIACLHPGFYKKHQYLYTYEKNPKSLAYIEKGINYYQGCFYGGKYNIFMEMSEQLEKNIDIDKENNIIAIWHDESHLNCYLNENHPIKILEPNYIYPTEYYNFENILKFKNNIKIEQKLKNHDELRLI